MTFDISKTCANFLRSFVLTQSKFRSSHARELVAAYFGYKSHASLLKDYRNPFKNLDEGENFLPDIALLEKRRSDLKELPEDLPSSEDLAKALSTFISEKKLIPCKIWSLSSLSDHIAEKLLIDEHGWIENEISGVISETYSSFDTYPDYEVISVKDSGDSIVFIAKGKLQGEEIYDDKPFRGNEIELEIQVTIDRIASMRGFSDFEFEILKAENTWQTAVEEEYWEELQNTDPRDTDELIIEEP